jgi:hypothetical protein
MPYARIAAAFLATAAAPIAAAAAETVTAVTTPHHGVLTMCRSWLVHRSCKPYYKVPIPEHVAVGDRIKLTFGSNPKDYIFHVAQIRLDGAGCTILSHASNGAEDEERLDVLPCRPAGKAAAAAPG